MGCIKSSQLPTSHPKFRRATHRDGVAALESAGAAGGATRCREGGGGEGEDDGELGEHRNDCEVCEGNERLGERVELTKLNLRGRVESSGGSNEEMARFINILQGRTLNCLCDSL